MTTTQPAPTQTSALPDTLTFDITPAMRRHDRATFMWIVAIALAVGAAALLTARWLFDDAELAYAAGGTVTGMVALLGAALVLHLTKSPPWAYQTATPIPLHPEDDD